MTDSSADPEKRRQFAKKLFSVSPTKAVKPSPSSTTQSAGQSATAGTAASVPTSDPVQGSSASSSDDARGPGLSPPTTSRARVCPYCSASIERPDIAIVCQSCNRFVVPLRLWHGAVAVAFLLAASFSHASLSSQMISALVGLVASQFLLFFAIRPLERHFISLIASFLLIPASIATSAQLLRFSDELPVFLRTSPIWLGGLAALALSAELFVHWQRAGKTAGLSAWRILGTFSIAVSGGFLILVILLELLSSVLTLPDGPGWQIANHMLRFRTGTLLLWLGYTILLAVPGAFARGIEVNSPSSGSLGAWILYVFTLAGRWLRNLGVALQEGLQDIFLLARTSAFHIARRLILLISVVSWQVSVSVLFADYQSYMVLRETHLIRALAAAAFALASPFLIFWSATEDEFAEVRGVAARTVTMTSLLLALCTAVASIFWWAYELLTDREMSVNWIAVASLTLIVLAFIFTRRDRP